VKTKSIIISQENTKVRSDSCHSEESRIYRGDEESKTQILRFAQNDKQLALSFCGGGEMREKMEKDGVRVK